MPLPTTLPTKKTRNLGLHSAPYRGGSVGRHSAPAVQGVTAEMFQPTFCNRPLWKS